MHWLILLARQVKIKILNDIYFDAGMNVDLNTSQLNLNKT